LPKQSFKVGSCRDIVSKQKIWSGMGGLAQSSFAYHFLNSKKK
jgi:hypothetical protein